MAGRPAKEWKKMQEAKPASVEALSLVGEDLTHWVLTVKGPAGTPYEGGKFKLDVVLPADYPFVPPVIKFLTKIYHPNVDEEGKACLPSLEAQNWAPSQTVANAVTEVVDLLRNPEPSHAVNAELGREFMEERAKFNATAKQWTAKHAK